MDNKVFFQHPDLMRALCVHETVMSLMVNTLNKAQQQQQSATTGVAELTTNQGRRGSFVPAGTMDSLIEQTKVCKYGLKLLISMVFVMFFFSHFQKKRRRIWMYFLHHLEYMLTCHLSITWLESKWLIFSLTYLGCLHCFNVRHTSLMFNVCFTVIVYMSAFLCDISFSSEICSKSLCMDTFEQYLVGCD